MPRLAWSPAARQLFAAQAGGVAVLRQRPGAGGQFHEVACRSLSPRAGRCGARPEEPVAISSSPDGRDIYVATAHRVTVLRVDARSGALRFGGCLGDGSPAQDGVQCAARIPGQSGFFEIVFTPDGRTGFMASGGRLVVLGRAAGGALRYRGCAGPSGSGCRRRAPTVSRRWLAIDTTGRDLYTAAGRLMHFRVSPRTGDPAYRECYGGPGTSCAQLLWPGFSANGPLALARDSRRLAALRSNGGALAVFTRSAVTGRLSPYACGGGCGGLGLLPLVVVPTALLPGPGGTFIATAFSTSGGGGLLAQLRGS
ncbi:MAG: hypothetical protein U0R70_00010 [Solirubrobacteraceae bacterium]